MSDKPNEPAPLRIDIVSDVVCPWCIVGFKQLEGAMTRLGDGLALVGSVDTVTRQLEGLLERLPARWLFAWIYNGLIPHEKLMRSIELFHSKVLPRVSSPG